MNIIVTGSNGFVGKNIVEYLKDKHRIIGIGTKTKSISCTDDYVQANIIEENFIEDKRFKDAEIIIHAAACKAKDDFCDDLVKANCVGTYNIIKLARKLKCKKVIYISSVPVIGSPIQEIITEDHSLFPNTMYHATKLAGEFMIDQLNKYEINGINFRIPSPVGKGMPDTTILSTFIKNAREGKDLVLYGKGSRRQNYIDVQDIGYAIEKCILADQVTGCFNIASANTISNYKLAELCIQLTNSLSNIVFNGMEDIFDNQSWDIDISKAYKTFGYYPQYNIKDSIKMILRNNK